MALEESITMTADSMCHVKCLHSKELHVFSKIMRRVRMFSSGDDGSEGTNSVTVFSSSSGVSVWMCAFNFSNMHDRITLSVCNTFMIQLLACQMWPIPFQRKQIILSLSYSVSLCFQSVRDSSMVCLNMRKFQWFVDLVASLFVVFFLSE